MDADPYVIDGHNDLAWSLREQGRLDLVGVDLSAGLQSLQTDLPRLRRGRVGGQFWSVFVPATITGDDAVRATLEQIDLVRRLVDRHPDALEIATSAEQVEKAARGGRVASLLGVEGGHCINDSLAVLRAFFAWGVRYMTLTHNTNVSWADSATDTPVAGGLTARGREIVAEMQRLGMFVDLSHVSDATMHDALDVATAPVIFSHSSTRAVCDVPRNVPDDVLARLPHNGGVCMVAFAAMFVSQDVADWYLDTLEVVSGQGGDARDYAAVMPVIAERMRSDPAPPCTADDVADHMEHLREVAGLAHIGIGGDYDGAPQFPVDMPDVSGYPRLLDVLRGRGWSEADIAAVAHGNVLRAMRSMEAAAG